MVFSPYWNIPPDILREETLPRVARDPDFLRRNNIEVVGTTGEDEDRSASQSTGATNPPPRNLRFRQRPGDDNALGLVKFVFPNHFNVYLHDTPNDRLFFKERRCLSHGCIRIEDPIAMAKYVMRDQPEWTEPRIREAMSARAGADGQAEDADSGAHRLLDRVGGAGRQDGDLHRRSLRNRPGAGETAKELSRSPVRVATAPAAQRGR